MHAELRQCYITLRYEIETFCAIKNSFNDKVVNGIKWINFVLLHFTSKALMISFSEKKYKLKNGIPTKL